MQVDTLYYHPNEVRGRIPELLVLSEADATLSLDYGWLCDDGVVLVEHKSLNDLAISLRNGHLVSQLEKAKPLATHVFLVVTGLPTRSPDGLLQGVMSEWRYRDFVAAVVAAVHGLQVCGPIYTSSREETCVVLSVLFNQTRRASIGKGRPVLPKWKATHGYDQAEAYARALPGIGWERAKAMAEAYPTWLSLVGALIKSKFSVKGIGPVLSKRISDLVMLGKV